MLGSPAHIGEELVLAPLRVAEDGQQVAPLLLRAHDVVDVAVGGGLLPDVGHRGDGAGAAAGRYAGVGHPRDVDLEMHREHLLQRDVYVLAFAIGLADERAHGRGGRRQPTRELAHVARDDDRRLGLQIASSSAIVEGDAAGVLHDEVVAEVVSPRAVLSEGRDRRHDQGGVGDTQMAIVELGCGHPCRRVLFDEDVGVSHELDEYLAAAAALHVKRDADLVCVYISKKPGAFRAGLVVWEGAASPKGIAVERLNFDHIGP